MTNRRTKDPFEPERSQRRSRRRETEDSRPTTEPRRRRWPLVLLFLVLLVALLPNIIGWLGLQKYAIDYALSDFQGNVSVGKASMGWMQPIQLSDVTATDLAGNELATIEEIKTSKPLYAFITGSDYGEVDIYKPFVHVHMRADGSNLEDSVSQYIATSQPSPMQPQEAASAPMALPKMLVRIHDGAASITSDGAQQTWKVDSLSVAAALSEPETPLAATAQFRAMTLIPNASGQLGVAESGTVLLKSAVDAGSNELTFSSANVELESDQFPLSIIAPLSQQFIGPAQMGGLATSKVVAAWNGATNEISTNIESLQVSNAQIVAPQLLNEDRFYVEQLSASGTMQLSSSQIIADQFIVETDFGRIDANGQFDPGQIASLSAGGQLPDTTLQMSGEIDVAKLLQRLPSTFQLHEDVTFESGTIQFNAGQRDEADARRLVVNVDTANIRATRSGQPIVWQQPLRIVGVLRESRGQISIERSEFISDFLTIEGKNITLREGIFTARGNLGELSERIRQFADLGAMRFGGTLAGSFGWKVVGENEVSMAQLANQPIQIGGEFVVTQPVIELPGTPRWSPEKIVIQTSGSGQLMEGNANSRLQLAQAGARLDVGNETAVLSLAKPVEDAFTNQQWVFNTQVVGQVEGWLQHVRNFVDPGDFQAGGALNFAGITIVDPTKVRVENGQYEIKQLGFEGYGASIREDRVVGNVTAGYSMETGDVDVQQASLQGSGVSATAQNLKLTTVEAMQLDGSAAFRADINRLAEWLSLSTEPDSINWFGAAEGTVEFRSSTQGTDARFNAEMTDVIATQRAAADAGGSPMQLVGSRQAWSEIWREPRVNLSGQMNIGSDFDSLNFQQLVTRSGSLDFDARGSISDLAGSMQTNLEGSWQPNFEKINSLLGAYSQNMVSLSGNGVQPFRIQGPLFGASGSQAWVPEQLIVQTVVAWDEGRLAGLPIGKSNLGIDLRQQLATMQTEGIPISGGSVKLQPQLDMRGSDPILTHGQARLLDNVQVTPEICRDGLKFVAPWLADTTNAQGVFSADIQGVSMPIMDPMNVSARGSLLMQDVTIAAGPMAEQLLGTVTQIQSILKPDSRERELKTWLKIEQQTIPVAVENRRVYHEGIKFSHDELIIRTSGSVGFDQSINMVAEIPIAEEWIADNRYLSGLRGQSLSIPVTGTVGRPIIDKNAVRQLSTDLVRNAAQGAIGNAITDKINPKLNEYGGQLNNRVTGEVNKLQNKFQDKLGGFLGDKFGLPSGGQNATPAQTPAPSAGQQIENQLNGQLQKGLNKLFGG